MQRAISRCNSRMLAFNNKNPSETVKKNQITKLLAQVDGIIADNGNQPYSNDLFTKAQMMTSQCIHIKDKEKTYVEQIKRLNEMMEKNALAMEERVRAVTAELEKQLKSARSAREAAEESALAEKKKLDSIRADLERQLESARSAQEAAAESASVERKKLDAIRAEFERQLESAQRPQDAAEQAAWLERKKLDAITEDLANQLKNWPLRPCSIL
ncbi:hypothetical protein SUGI_0291250 [Cryptomeria japonica]|nr:hypothetical protein SUGI_0291250 [Cryptomeria japonica]